MGRKDRTLWAHDNDGRATEDKSDEWVMQDLNYDSQWEDTKDTRGITHYRQALAQRRHWNRHLHRHPAGNSSQSQRESKESPISTRGRGQPMQGPFLPFGRHLIGSRRRSGPCARGRDHSLQWTGWVCCARKLVSRGMRGSEEGSYLWRMFNRSLATASRSSCDETSSSSAVVAPMDSMSSSLYCSITNRTSCWSGFRPVSALFHQNERCLCGAPISPE